MSRPALRRRLRVGGVLATIAALGIASSADYVIQPGDTLSSIAARNGTTVRQLVAANGISDPHRIIAGQRLSLSAAASRSSAPAGGAAQGSHTVRAGESLSVIARRHGVSVRQLASANGIADANLVRVGQRLTVPGASGGGSAAPAPASGAQPPPASVTRANVGVLLDSTARRYGMSPAFVKAVAWQESGWNMNRVSSANAIGVMQVLPSTGRWVSRSLVGRTLDLNDPADNIEAGVAFLRYLYRHTGGDVRMTLAGYYQGLASVSRNGMYQDTERYIANVLALRERF
jgi:N-acetylmuramoyl-L-alanine amidase